MRRLLSLSFLFLCCLNLLLPSQPSGRELPIEIYFFFEKGCPYSRKINNFLTERIENHYPVKIKKLEIHEDDHLQIMFKMAQERGAEEIINQGVPAVFIGPYAFQGASRRTERLIEKTLREIILNKKASAPPAPSPPEKVVPTLRLSYPLIFSTGLLSAFNPCSLGVFILFLGSLITLTQFQRMRLLVSGLLFSLTYFCGSLLVGLGLRYSLRETNLRAPFSLGVALLAIGGGIYYLWSGLRHSRKETYSPPPGWKNLFQRFLTIPGSMAVGALAVFFLFPCSSGPYLAVLALLARPEAKSQAITGLILYNAAFILPFVLLTLALGGGLFSWDRISTWQKNHQHKLKLVLGLLLILLGAWLLLTLV